MALGKAGLGTTVRSPILADAGSTGVGLPAGPLRPSPAQCPALKGGWAALTGLQLPHPGLQVLVLREGEERKGWPSFPHHLPWICGVWKLGQNKKDT